MQEYWFNVYQYNGKNTWISKNKFEKRPNHHSIFSKPAYRIHVKMDGGYRTSGRAYPRKMVNGFIVVRGYAPIKRPYEIPMVYSSKQDWVK